MEKRILKKIIPFVIVAAFAYGILSYHFILFDDKLKILKKADMKLENTFVDARGENQLKILLNPDLVKAGINDIIESTANKLKR